MGHFYFPVGLWRLQSQLTHLRMYTTYKNTGEQKSQRKCRSHYITYITAVVLNVGLRCDRLPLETPKRLIYVTNKET